MKVRLLLLFNGNIVRIERGMTLAAVASIVLPMIIQFFWPSSVVCLSVFLSFSLLLSLSLCLSMSIYVCLSLFVCTFIQCLCYTWIQMRHFLPSGYWIGWWPSDDLCSSPFQFTTPCLSLSPRRHFCEEEGRDGYSGRDVHRRSGGERGEHGRGAIWKGSVR